MFDPETANYMLTLIEGGLSYIQQTARHHEHGTVTHHHGEDDHLEFSLSSVPRGTRGNSPSDAPIGDSALIIKL